MEDKAFRQKKGTHGLCEDGGEAGAVKATGNDLQGFGYYPKMGRLPSREAQLEGTEDCAAPKIGLGWRDIPARLHP